MNEYAKTGLFVAGAAVLVFLASVTGSHGVQHQLFLDEGELMFPQFTDPGQAVDLTVIEFDSANNDVKPFNVTRDAKGVWTIPSHSNYPADAKTRMAQAASMFIGTRKDRVISDSPEDYPKFGVVDPQDASAQTEGRGMRVTIKDSAGTALVDVILGKTVEGKTDTRYVRFPDKSKKRVYAVKLPGELSKKFEDWIERDLLKTSSYDLEQIVFDNYSVDEDRGLIVKGDKFDIKKDAQQKWQLSGLGTSEETNEDKVREITDALTQLKIVGVRAKPAGITAALKTASGIDLMKIRAELSYRGYFVGPDGNIVSNEGELIAKSQKGVDYTLRFGEIVPGSGDAVSAGTGDDQPPAQKPGETGPPKIEGSHRYLMITAEFDESLLKKPEQPRFDDAELAKRKSARDEIEAIVKAVDDYKASHEGKLPDNLAQLTEGDKPALKELKKDPWGADYVLTIDGDKFTVSSLGADQKPGGENADADVANDKFAFEDGLEKTASDWKAYDQKVKDGRKEADQLTRRFGPWYYVIDAESYAKLKPARKDLAKEKAAEPAKDGPAIPDLPKEPGK